MRHQPAARRGPSDAPKRPQGDAEPAARPGLGLWDELRAAETDPAILARLETLSLRRRRVSRGEQLFGNGEPLRALHVVRAGQFKTCILAADGRSQVTGFQMAGDLLGLDGIETDRHRFDAVALEDAQVMSLPYEPLNDLLQVSAALQHGYHRIMSCEIVREHEMMRLLGQLSAEERVAVFVLDLLRRNAADGQGDNGVLLRMTREDIGSYLGLKIETVSRSFSKLHGEGVLAVRHRRLQVLDCGALQRIAHRGRG